MNKFAIYTTAILTFCATATLAQEDNTEQGGIQSDVDVINEYQPTLHVARKLRVAPFMDDTASYRPDFKYTTLGRISMVTTKPDSLTAAGMTFPAYQSPYNALVEGAIGFVPTIYGQLYYNTGNSKQRHFATRIGHLAQLGKVELENGDKVKAPQNDTWAALDYHNFSGKNRFGANFALQNSAYRYYGMHTLADTVKYLDESGTAVMGSELIDILKQRSTTVDLGLNFANVNANPKRDITFDLNGGVGLFFNNSGVRETDIKAGTKLLFPIAKLNSAIDADVFMNYYRVTTPVGEDTVVYRYFDRHGLDINVYPHYRLIKDFMELSLGLRLIATVGDDNVKDDFIVQPDLNVNFFIGDGSVRFYAGLTGDYKQNSYRQLFGENRYLSADSRMYVYSKKDSSFVARTEIKPTQSPILFKAGLRAKINKMVQMHIAMDYRSLGDENIYVNRALVAKDSSTFAHSQQFALLQDDGKLLRAHVEINVNPTDNSNILARATFFNYDMNYLGAWHKPSFRFDLNSRFKPTDRVGVHADLSFEGKRDAYSPTERSTVSLDPYIDLNIGGSYYISNQLTVTLDMNNLTAADQRRWLGYSSRRVNVLAGVRYKF
ncbi:MAG: hypothetical protein II951_07725 [Bacteroidales bacterium]|nr:hypothetical protein [Bacteroidales bacterium]